MQRTGWLTINGPQQSLFFQVDRLPLRGYRLWLGWHPVPSEYFYATRAECFAVLRLIRNLNKGV